MCICAVCDLLVYGMCSVYMFGTYVYMCNVWCMWYVQMYAISGVCVCVCSLVIGTCVMCVYICSICKGHVCWVCVSVYGVPVYTCVSCMWYVHTCVMHSVCVCVWSVVVCICVSCVESAHVVCVVFQLRRKPFAGIASASSSSHFQSASSLCQIWRASLADERPFPKELEGRVTPIAVLHKQAPAPRLLHPSHCPVLGWGLTSHDIGSHARVLKPPMLTC